MKKAQLIGTYNEVSIHVPVNLPGSDSSEVFAHLFLPVNSEKARWGGVEVNGFPKTLAAIDIRSDNEFVYCVLKENDKLIFDFKMELRPGEEKTKDWIFIGNRKGRLLKTIFNMKGEIYSGDDPGMIELNFGSHPVSSKLQKSIVSLKPRKIEIGHKLKGVLRKPVEPE